MVLAVHDVSGRSHLYVEGTSVMDDEKKALRQHRAMEKRLKRVQRHHITYHPERTVIIFQGEHFIVTQMQRRKYVSAGFIAAMEFEINRMKQGKVWKLAKYYKKKMEEKKLKKRNKRRKRRK